ncbi:MAG TPA: sigma-70 family RNA polymerase sigma factor [Armatimonadota bacterium]|nr:sigma-70 family RNA polymerase sigma factor [Armatimonadota bacterium]
MVSFLRLDSDAPGASGESEPAPDSRESSSERLTASMLHDRYLQSVFRFVSYRLSNRSDAEDVTAEVFEAAFAGLQRFRGDCDPYFWLLGIARRKIVDHLRRRIRRRETLASELSENGTIEDAADMAASEAAPEPTEARDEIRRLMSELNEDQRVALLLKYVEGLSTSEVAIVMKRSPAAANSLLQRARASLFERGKDFFLNPDAERDDDAR